MADIETGSPTDSLLEPDVDENIEENAGEEGEEEGYSFLDQEPEPCNNFRLDTTRSFGMCKCGHPKAAHVVKSENKAAALLSKLKNNNQKTSIESEAGLIEPGDKACNKFRVDTTATEFGMCKCGFKRLDHVGQQDNRAQQALLKLKESNLDKYRNSMDLKKLGTPCDNYRVDISASEFGVCLCGFKKDDHLSKDENAAAKMLKNLKEKNVERHNLEDKQAKGEAPLDGQNELEKDVAQLDSAEQNAAQGDAEQKQEAKKKQGKCCIIS